MQGLHVKMDLSSGRKQAKNMENNDSGSSVALMVNARSDRVKEISAEETHAPAETDVVDDMVRILQALPKPDESFTSLLKRRDSLSRAELAKRMREVWNARQAELKVAMASAKTEAQQMQEVLTSLIDRSATPTEIIDTLDDLTFFVGSKDSAVDFAGMGGLEAAAFLLNDTLPSVRAAASITIGTCIRYVPLLQRRAHDLGVLTVATANLREAARSIRDSLPALRTAHSASDYHRVFEEQSKLASRSIFVLGALCRGSPVILQRFLSSGGYAALHEVVQLLTPAALQTAGEGLPWDRRSQLWHSQDATTKSALLGLVGKIAAFVGDVAAEGHYVRESPQEPWLKQPAEAEISISLVGLDGVSEEQREAVEHLLEVHWGREQGLQGLRAGS
jgi:hypothetical protein